jgi:hypothetical protein
VYTSQFFRKEERVSTLQGLWSGLFTEASSTPNRMFLPPIFLERVTVTQSQESPCFIEPGHPFPCTQNLITPYVTNIDTDIILPSRVVAGIKE